MPGKEAEGIREAVILGNRWFWGCWQSSMAGLFVEGSHGHRPFLHRDWIATGLFLRWPFGPSFAKSTFYWDPDPVSIIKSKRRSVIWDANMVSHGLGSQLLQIELNEWVCFSLDPIWKTENRRRQIAVSGWLRKLRHSSSPPIRK